MNIRPLNNNIMFEFLDQTAGPKGGFIEKHGTFLIPQVHSTQKVARWGQVIALGPKALAGGLAVGDYILIEALMWMEAVKVDGRKMWKTDDSKVLAVTNDKDSCQSQAL